MNLIRCWHLEPSIETTNMEVTDIENNSDNQNSQINESKQENENSIQPMSISTQSPSSTEVNDQIIVNEKNEIKTEGKVKTFENPLVNLKKLAETSKTMVVHLQKEFDHVLISLEKVEEWLDKCKKLIVKERSTSSIDFLLKLMWRTAVIAGFGEGRAPETVPEDGIFDPQKLNLTKEVYCYCKLPEVYFYLNYFSKNIFLVMFFFFGKKREDL